MTTLSLSDFRSNMASAFDLVDAGEFVFVNRGRKKTYSLVLVKDDDLTISPQLAARIEKARQEYREGKTIKFANAAEAQKWMDEL